MAKSKVKSKTKSTSKLIGRLRAAEILGVGRATVERLVAEGRLRPVATKGRAHAYDLAEVRRLARDVAAGRDPGATDVIVRDLAAMTLDLRDRLRALCEAFIADAHWLPAWTAVVRWFSRRMQAWPAHIEAVLATVTPQTAVFLDAMPLTLERPRRLVAPAELLELLDGPRESWPWRPAAAPLLRAIATSGRSVWLSEGGGWCEEGACLPPRPPVQPIRLVNPLLSEISTAIRSAREFQRLDALLAAPKPKPVPAAPKDVNAARRQWRAARADFREQRVAVRRGHRERSAVARAVQASFEAAGAAWRAFGGRAPGLAGDGARARAEVERLVAETLARLGALDGFLVDSRHVRMP